MAHRRELRAAFKRLEQEIPEKLARALRWLRHPKSRLVRIPVGLLFVVGGVFSFLPALGLWMLPIGLLLLAYDVPLLRRPMARFTIWSADKWAALRHFLTSRQAQDRRLRRAQTPPERPQRDRT
jgi:hypothetical protein